MTSNLTTSTSSERGAAAQPAAGEAGSATIATVERAADILLHFAETPQPDLGVTEIADALGLSKAAVHRVLASLRGRGFIRLDENSRRYSLGVSAMKLGQSYLERIDVRRVARPYLERLSRHTGETTTLSVPSGPRSRIYVDQVTPDRAIIMAVPLGVPEPLHAGAPSRVLLAFAPPERREAYLSEAPFAPLAPGTVTDPDALRAGLGRVRERGWAHSVAERRSGAASVAAPVFDHNGAAQAVISVCGPLERFSEGWDACRAALLETTRALSTTLGWSG